MIWLQTILDRGYGVMVQRVQDAQGDLYRGLLWPVWGGPHQAISMDSLQGIADWALEATDKSPRCLKCGELLYPQTGQHHQCKKG